MSPSGKKNGSKEDQRRNKALDKAVRKVEKRGKGNGTKDKSPGRRIWDGRREGA